MSALIQSYVKNKYFISTIHRESSAMTDTPIWYYETMVWGWDKEIRQRSEHFLLQVDSGNTETDALNSHLKICRNYL